MGDAPNTVDNEMVEEIEGVVALHRRLLEAWNRRDAAGMAELIANDGSLVGFDGSQMNGRQAIGAELERIFQDHIPAAYVWKVREVRFLAPEVAILRAVVGMVPPGQVDIAPSVNAIQSLVAIKSPSGWQIALFQNTPAQFHGRPDLVAQLNTELRALL